MLIMNEFLIATFNKTQAFQCERDNYIIALCLMNYGLALIIILCLLE